MNHLTLRGRGRSATAALVAVELVVAAVAVSAAATLVTIQPASARPPVLTAPPVNPAHLFGTVGSADLHATVNPPSPGNQSIQVSLTDAASGLPLEDVDAVTAELDPPRGSDIDGRSVELEPAEEVPGLFGANGAYTSDVGDWTMTLVVQRDGRTAEIEFVVPVSRQAPAEPAPAPDTGIVVPAPLAAIWTVLPSGILGWLPTLAGLLAMAMTGRLRPSGLRASVRLGVVALVVLGGIGAATRSIVDAANAPATAQLEAPPASPDAARGEGIYLANCASCHGRDGSGDGPIETAPHPPPLAEVVPGTTPGELSYRIAYGVAGTPMPAFAGTLTRDERWALVAYLRERWATGP